MPLFAYGGHIVLAHLLAGLRGFALGFGDAVMPNIFFAYPDAWGFGLPFV